MKTEVLRYERQRVTEALKESEQRYKRLLSATTDYIYTVNLERGQTRSTSHGPGCEAVTGYSAADFAADPYLWYRVIHQDDRPTVLRQVDRILRGELPPPLEHRIIHRDGNLRWIRNTTIPHYDDAGNLMGYDGLISDITERKLSEEALALERNLLRTLVDNLPDYIFVKDRTGRFIMDNLPHAQALGATDIAQVLGKTDADFVSGADALQHQLAEESVCRSGQPQYNVEESTVDSAGRQRWFSATRVPVKDSKGRVSGLVSILHDITEHKRAEQALRESQERLALVIRGSNDGIWDWNVLTNETYFSPRWKSMLGYGDEEIANQFSAWEQLIHPDDRVLAKERVRAYLAGETTVYELEHRLRHKNGTYRCILARGVALRNDRGQPVRMAGSHVDLTELKNAAEQLRQANKELLETRDQLILAARFESMGTLAAGVAHEVKNPLQTILMGLHFLSRKLGSPDEDLALTLKDMHDAVTRANSIISDLATLSRSTPFQVTCGNLNRIIERSLHLTKIELDAAKVTPALVLAEDLPPARLDETKMEQVFLNLFLNAVQAMPSGGTLTVSTRTVLLDQDMATMPPFFRKFGKGQRLVFAEVRDTGTGIKPADLLRVFDPFFTTKEAGVGTGLGLSIARMIIHRHGGAIEINNAPEGGVLVTIALKADPEDCP